MEQTFGNNTEVNTDELEGASTKVKNKISEVAGRTRDKAEEVGRTVQSKIDENRGPAASKLESAASTLHRNAENLPGGDTVRDLAHNAADKMQATAEYVRRHDVNGMMQDVETFVRRHPGESLLTAAAVGFLVGLSLKRNDV